MEERGQVSKISEVLRAVIQDLNQLRMGKLLPTMTYNNSCLQGHRTHDCTGCGCPEKCLRNPHFSFLGLGCLQKILKSARISTRRDRYTSVQLSSEEPARFRLIFPFISFFVCFCRLPLQGWQLQMQLSRIFVFRWLKSDDHWPAG